MSLVFSWVTTKVCLLPIILTNPDFPYSPTPQNLGENEEEKVTGKAPIGCASFTLIFICLDAGESPPPVERGERASQPHLGLQAVAGSHLHLLQIACWLVLNGNTCQMLLQIFCRIERERERERERRDTHTHTMGRMASMCHQITRDDQQDDDADADDVVLVDLLKILRSETGALNDQSVFYSLLVGEMIFISFFFGVGFFCFLFCGFPCF